MKYYHAENQTDCSILIRETPDGYEKIIFSHGDITTHRYEKDQFYHLLIENCHGCIIVCSVKVISLMMHRSSDCTVILLGGSLGAVNLYKCRNLEVQSLEYIPVVCIEESVDIDYTGILTGRTSFLVDTSYRIVAKTPRGDDSMRTFPMGKILWGPEERILYVPNQYGVEMSVYQRSSGMQNFTSVRATSEEV